jgi:NAD(P)-dependent dehydrogenase (short-subunit alcohol dehydrogenase family)
MSYFVTGATGFIGRNLVERLLKREGTIYALVREGSRGRLEELKSRWGAPEDRIVPVIGDLSQPRLGCDDQIAELRGKVDHFFHLAAIYDMTADAESQRIANVEGTRGAVELAGALEAGRFHMVSSIAAAGLYRGTWREDMFDEAENLDTHPYFRTKHDSEAVVRNESEVPWRVYRPGIVVGNSQTGEMDKIDGPYYFFKLIRRLRGIVPQWVPLLGVEGREINLVPVDFVARAMDHIAHLDGLDGKAFSLTDPEPRSAGEVIDIFAGVANAPQSSLRLPAGAIDAVTPLLQGLTMVPPSGMVADAVLSDLGIPRSVLTYVNYPTSFDNRQAQAALEGTDIRVPPLESYADKLWDYWERILDPELYRDRSLAGAVRGRIGVIGGATQVLGQQVPDEVLRLVRRVRGAASLDAVVRGRVVLITGASSGIGRAAAVKIARAGGIVLLVSRTREKLDEVRDEIEQDGGAAFVHPCDLSDTDDIDRMCDEVLAEHGQVDILVNNAGKSIRRSIALSYDRFHDFQRTMQLNYFGPVKLMLKLLPRMRERKQGHVVNISSIGVQTNTPRFSAYVASKAALDAFSRAIASEMVDDGVTVTTIHMPLVRTPMISPTKMYNRFPTITPEKAADMIGEAIIHKPKRIATPLGTLGQLLYAINPRSMDYVLNTAYQLFPDSKAARGEKEKPTAPSTDEEASSQQVAFAYLMRGVHW